MTSTGNDIIALQAIDKERTRATGFYSKILSAAEQALYEQQAASLPFEHFIWLSWSVKESVYKYLKRAQADLIFSPTRIIVSQIEIPSAPVANFEGRQWEGGSDEVFCTGRVVYGEFELFFKSKIFTECIATVVGAEENFNDTWWGVRMIEDTGHAQQSSAVRELAVRRLQGVFPGMDDIKIEKSLSGHPVIYMGDRAMETPGLLGASWTFRGLFFFGEVARLPVDCMARVAALFTADLGRILPDKGLPSC